MRLHNSVPLFAALAIAMPLGAQQTAPAASPPAQTITFDQAIDLALKNNAQLRMAQNAAASDATTVRQQKNQYLPSLSLNSSTATNLGRTFSQSEGAIIDQTSQSMNAGVQSSLTLFDASRGAALKGAKLSEQASDQDVARAQQTAVFTVAQDFLNLVTQQEQLRVQQQNLAAQQAVEKQIQAYVNAGTKPISDLYQQQATVASTQSAVVNAQKAVELAKVDLMQAMQLDPRGSYDFVPPELNTSGTTTPALPMDSALTLAMGQRKDLAAAETRVGAAQAGVSEAKAGRLPTVAITAGYNTAFNSAVDSPFGSQLNDRRGGSVSLGVSIPLFDRGAASTAEQKAEIAADNARIQLQQQQQQVGLEVRQAYLNFQAAQQQLEAANAQMKAAQLALDASTKRYQVGAGTLVEVTQAQAQASQAASAQVSARYNLLFQRTLIDYYTGALVPQHPSLG